VSIEYLGILPQGDPLYQCLLDGHFSKGGRNGGGLPLYRVYRMNASNQVYVYEDIESGDRVVGKFFGPQNGSLPRAQQEFRNMCILRNLGFTAYPHYIARPLGYHTWLDDLLIQEYCEGQSLGSIIENSMAGGEYGSLYRALQTLAHFLATLHNRTAIDAGVDAWKDYHYLDNLLSSLVRNRDLPYDEGRILSWMGEQWLANPAMWEDVQVLVHGDATPGNFLVDHSFMITAIDLERLQYRDRAYDLGRLAGELKHHFMNTLGNGNHAEPFIHYFLMEYASHFPDRVSAFNSITRRLPFHMGLTLLRIARNSWLDRGYRLWLIDEATVILRTW